MSQSVMRNLCMCGAIFNVMVTARPIWSKYDSFSYIFLTVDSLATKLGLVIHHQKPECLVKKKRIAAFRVKLTAKGQNVSVCPDDISKPPFILFPNSVLWCIIYSLWIGVSCKKIDLLFSRLRSLQELLWSKYDNFYCIFWSADPLATKMVW